MSSILSPISLMAWSHDSRCHSPLTSFIGYFRRRSPCTSSRTEAPLAQCEPRLIGLSQAGSWPTQTPFWTSAITVQPTEQCVQMFFLTSVGAPTIFGPACALRTEPSGSRPNAAPALAARPDLRRKVRRPRAPHARPAAAPRQPGPPPPPPPPPFQKLAGPPTTGVPILGPGRTR